MEFKFNINEIFRQPIVEINHTLIPPGFSGDRRALWDVVGKVAEVVNAMGEASAAAQGLTKPITTAERLRNSEQRIYLLVDQKANNGRGAVTGMLKTGSKGLYVFNREGHHYQVSPVCVLDFYVHESRQRSGYGRHLFEHMLQKEKVEPVKMAIDRPSEKFLGFLNKHYKLNEPIKQMNNYVVFDDFFPRSPEKNTPTPGENDNGNIPSRKQSANGLQTSSFISSPYGRYGAPRPTCSMNQIIHNQTSTIQKSPERAGDARQTRSEPATNHQNRPFQSYGPAQSMLPTDNVYQTQVDNQYLYTDNNVLTPDPRPNQQQSYPNNQQQAFPNHGAGEKLFNTGDHKIHGNEQDQQANSQQYYSQLQPNPMTYQQQDFNNSQPQYAPQQNVTAQETYYNNYTPQQQSLAETPRQVSCNLQPPQLPSQNQAYIQQYQNQQPSVTPQNAVRAFTSTPQFQQTHHLNPVVQNRNALPVTPSMNSQYQVQNLQYEQSSYPSSMTQPAQSEQGLPRYQNSEAAPNLSQNVPEIQPIATPQHNSNIANTANEQAISATENGSPPQNQPVVSTYSSFSNIPSSPIQPVNSFPNHHVIPFNHNAQSLENMPGFSLGPSLGKPTGMNIANHPMHSVSVPSPQNLNPAIPENPIQSQHNISGFSTGQSLGNPPVMNIPANSMHPVNVPSQQNLNPAYHLNPTQSQQNIPGFSTVKSMGHSAGVGVPVPLKPNTQSQQSIPGMVNISQRGNYPEMGLQNRSASPSMVPIDGKTIPYYQTYPEGWNVGDGKEVRASVSQVNYPKSDASPAVARQMSYAEKPLASTGGYDMTSSAPSDKQAPESDELTMGYPPQSRMPDAIAHVPAALFEEQVSASPRLERPRSLSIQLNPEEPPAEETNANDIESEVPVPQGITEEAPDEPDAPETQDRLDNNIKKISLADVINPQEDDKPVGKKTPSHLTEQGFLDLKFYHSKLW